QIEDDIGKDIYGQGQMPVENLDVVARVFLGRECVELSTDGIDLLRDAFGRARACPLEEHVLDKVRDAALLGGFMARASCEPDADADGAHLSHALGQDAKAVVENVSDDR